MSNLLPRARVATRVLNKRPLYRAHHTATGRFITITAQGTPKTREIEVSLGDPGEAYVMFDVEIGQAFKAGTLLHGGCSLAQDQDLYPLDFHHDTRHFSHKSSPYPRLEIPQDLPRQSTSSHSSPATLHTWGMTHAITIDGTPDADFHHSMRESMQRLQPVLDELKDL